MYFRMLSLRSYRNQLYNLASNCSLTKRYIYSVDGNWPKEYNVETAKKLESYWRPILDENQRKYSENDEVKKLPKKYILSMFPYPSGRLHMGHVRVYTLSDLFARFYRMQGNYVIHPIGWDAFGLPAENAAIERGVKPNEWTIKNIDYMRDQLKEISFSFDWNRELMTCDPSYYTWTQYLFLKFYEKGLAYQKEAMVNWDPVDKTVLAYEQIDEKGRSWRSGAAVEKKYMKQWFIRSTAFAKSLLDELKVLGTEDWSVIKKAQKEWIGKCDGCFIEFNLSDNSEKLSVYTKQPYAIYGISHIEVNADNSLIERFYKNLKEGDKLPIEAVNPLNNQKIPIYLNSGSDYGLINPEGRPILSSRLSIPSLIDSDRLFADKHGIKYTEIFEDKEKKENIINSGELNGRNNEDAFEIVTQELQKVSAGGYKTSEKLKDWVVSRQRYWGTPCPMIYCKKCDVVPVPYEQLPVLLPEVDEKSTKGISQLLNSEWKHTKCPKCGGNAVRETDTMDTFVDSSWYFLRYLDSKNDKELLNADIAAKQMPVDLYIGGAEHAITHLFVSRLVSHFLYEQKLLPTKEPFQRFIAIGMVKGESFRTKSGKYIEPALAVKKGEEYFHKESGELLERDIEKMSKSKLNGIEPHYVIENYGLDFTRLFILGYVHPRSDRSFILSSDMISGTMHLLETIWNLVGIQLQNENNGANGLSSTDIEKWNNELYKTRNASISMANYNLTGNFNIPSYIVAIQKLAKFLKKVPVELHSDAKYQNALAETLILISPAIPHFANECWSALKSSIKSDQFNKATLVTEQNWPEVDGEYLLPLYFQVNSKEAGEIQIKKKEIDELTEDKALQLMKKAKLPKKFANISLDNFSTLKLDIEKSYNATLNVRIKKN